MTTEVTETKPVAAWKVKLVAGVASVSGLVAAASAAVDLNGTIGPILDSVIELIPTLIELIIQMVPAIITLALVGFVVAFLDRILSMMKL